jgi:hypothetical protein
MPEKGEVPQSETQGKNRARVNAIDISKVADLASKQGKSEVAEELRQIAQTPIGTPVHPEQAQQTQQVRPSIEGEAQSAPLSNPAKRLDTHNVEAMMSALEQAKKLPVPPGEEPGQFYYRKAMELLSQGKELQK